MEYGARELAYAEPFADALSTDPLFRSWVLKQTRFGKVADEARLLADEMLMQRSRGTRNWWRSHFTEACRCMGCSGQETDLLAVFADSEDRRFAMHFEVKRPGDKFKAGQANAYPLRAECWRRNPPPKVLPHSRAAVALLCSETDLLRFGPNLDAFPTIITFDEVERQFPQATRVRQNA